MITDVTRLPPRIECLECHGMFTKDTFLWHNCGDASGESDAYVDVDAEDDAQEIEEQQSARLQIPEPLERLPFRFLAPSEQADVVELLRSHLRKSPSSGYYSGVTDWSRLHDITKSFKASVLALGEDGWSGYAVFELPKEGRFLLDSVILGNAAFVIDGDWREAIQYSKAEIREEYRDRHRRIVHTGDWIGKMRTALSQKNLWRNS